MSNSTFNQKIVGLKKEANQHNDMMEKLRSEIEEQFNAIVKDYRQTEIPGQDELAEKWIIDQKLEQWIEQKKHALEEVKKSHGDDAVNTEETRFKHRFAEEKQVEWDIMHSAQLKN